jgi:hypothetical protein
MVLFVSTERLLWFGYVAMALLVAAGLIGAVFVEAWGYVLFYAALLLMAGAYALFLGGLSARRSSKS